MREPAFTLGVEEEYLLVHAGTGELDDDPPSALFEAFTERLGEQAGTEFLRSQVEVETRVCRTVAEVRDDLIDLRRAIAAIAGEFGRAPLAASTHPFGRSRAQKPTEKDRYVAIAEEVQAARRHMLICGMHVHVGLEDEELRLDLMNQLAYFLPHLLALSTSSPFFEGENTGFRSFRLNLLSSLPRAGLPERFASWQEYQRNVDILVGTGVIPDTSKIWWDLRPSWRYPTLEVRIMDMCTSVEDSVTLAALVQSLTRMLWRLRAGNKQWRVYSSLLVGENRWRAMRYSCDEPLLDLGRGELVPFRQLAEEIVELVREDADALGCMHEVERIREIAERGTSAHRQVRVFESARERGAEDREALEAVVRSLTAETMDNVTA
jgi:carboxylate-amine ligase